MKNTKKILQIGTSVIIAAVIVTFISLQETTGKDPFSSNGNVLTSPNGYAKTNTGRSTDVGKDLGLSDKYFEGGRFSF